MFARIFHSLKLVDLFLDGVIVALRMGAADELANESGKEHLGANDHGQHANVKQR